MTTWLEELLRIPSPLRMVDSIDPLLHLDDNTAVLGNRTWEVGIVEEALGLLEGHATVLEVARVKLHGLLVGVYVELNSGPWGRKTENVAAFAPVKEVFLFAGDSVAVVYKQISRRLGD